MPQNCFENVVILISTPFILTLNPRLARKKLSSLVQERRRADHTCQGDLVSRLIMGIIGVLYGLYGLLTYLLRPSDPPSRFQV